MSSTGLKQRKNIRLAPQNYVGQRIYFVTLCCHKRQGYFAEVSFARVVLACLASLAKKHSFVLYAYCAMPDHLHFLARGSASSDLLAFVTAFKQRTTRMQKQRSALPLWQAKFHDHILRDADGIEAVAHYIWANPVRNGLCPDAASYLLSGSQVIDWKARTASSWMWFPPWKGRPGSAALRAAPAETAGSPGPTTR